ncbi:MAG: hypothetical protein J2P37_08005, partial [Ktedonobacteraceae bacterium]|nr:hypothetical protein [Ktedonobacteraceae bacterium]
ALLSWLSWLPMIYWTNIFPQLVELLRQVPWLDPAGLGRANLQLLLLLVASALMLLMVSIGSWLGRKRLRRFHQGLLFLVMLVFTAGFAVTFCVAPAGVNVLVQNALAPGGAGQGPLWIDLNQMITLLAGESVVDVLLGFRLVGVLVHVVNTVLIWLIVGRTRPEARLSTTLLYAWNPLVLLLVVLAPNLGIVALCLLLLAALCYQRDRLMLSWVFVVLAALIYLQFVFFLPLMLHIIMRKTRMRRAGRRALWWLGFWIISLLVVALAYLPYWQDGSINTQLTSLRQVFWPDQVANSLASALLNLPLSLPPQVAWLVDGHYWVLAALVLVGLFFLLALWLADTLELVLLCGCWILLLLLIFMPVYWPWFVLVPLVLGLCAESQSTKLLVVFLTLGALLDYYFWQWPRVWTGQALVAVWLPLLLWGWALFFASTWRMARARAEAAASVAPAKGISRPPWFPWGSSRPGRLGR